jgi:hypothetical protein
MTKDEAIEFLKKEGVIFKTNFLDDVVENIIILVMGIALGFGVAKLFF